MASLQLPRLVLGFVLFNLVYCKELCDFSDVECMTKVSKRVYKTVMNGVQGLTEPCDPLYKDRIKGEIINLKYEITNVSLTGMKNCEMERLICYKENSTYESYLNCPKLVLDNEYEAKGILGLLQLDGKGSNTAIATDYHVIFRGKYGKVTSGKDQKPRIHVKGESIQTELKGDLTFITKNLSKGDKTKSNLANKYLNDHSKEMEPFFSHQIIEVFMSMFAERIDIYLKNYPLEEIIYKED